MAAQPTTHGPAQPMTNTFLQASEGPCLWKGPQNRSFSHLRVFSGEGISRNWSGHQGLRGALGKIIEKITICHFWERALSARSFHVLWHSHPSSPDCAMAGQKALKAFPILPISIPSLLDGSNAASRGNGPRVCGRRYGSRAARGIYLHWRHVAGSMV